MNIENAKTQFWNSKYDGDHYSFGESPNQFLTEQLSLVKRCRHAFLPADGEGRNGVWLARQGINVHSCDLSVKGVRKSKLLAKKLGVAIDAFQADLLNYEYPFACYDLIAVFFLHLEQAQQKRVYQGLWQSLKVGGFFIMEGYHPDHIACREEFGSVGGPPDGLVMITAQSILENFDQAHIHILTEERVELNEGATHKGLSSVTRVVLQKK